MNAPFTLTGKRANFKKLTLSGLASILVAMGDVDLSQGNLNFEARVHLLGKMPVPLLSKLAQLVDPLSAFGNIEIGGTFEKPDWEFKLRPGKGPRDILFPKGFPLQKKQKKE